MPAKDIIEGGLEVMGRKIDSCEAASRADMREANRMQTLVMLDRADPAGLRYLEETSLTRVWQHANNPDTPLGIITAFRQDKKPEENARANRQLAADLRQRGFGYFFLQGSYTMESGETVSEISLFVVGRKGESEKLSAALSDLRQKYGQESVLFKPEGGNVAFLLFADRQVPIGQLQPNKVSNFMSELVLGAGRGGSFVFEEIAHTMTNRGLWGALQATRALAAKIGAPVQV